MEIPRRARLDLMSPAERMIYNAVQGVEAMPPDVRLTDAVILLGAARESVADFVDGIYRRRSVSIDSASPASAVVPPICNVCDQPIQHELVCEDCLSERGYVQSAVVPPAAAEAPHENAEPSEPLEIIENDASIEGPSKPLCWVPQPISEGMARCDRAKRHKGKHSWEKESVVTEDLRAAAQQAYVILKGLHLSVQWELAPSIMKAIAELVPKLESALAARAPERADALRHAWEAGFALCRSYGDNFVYFDGEQKERQWKAYLAARAPQREGGQ